MNDCDYVYHCYRARELAALAVAATVQWDPMGCVCEHVYDVLHGISSIVVDLACDGRVDDGIWLRLRTGRKPVVLPWDWNARNGTETVMAMWRAVEEELGAIVAENNPDWTWANWCTCGVSEIIEDHLEPNL